jgi:hypothetical protein
MKPGRDNYEIWVTDWLDGKLTAGEESVLMSFLDANPDLKQEVRDAGSLRLTPSDDMLEGKASLKKQAADYHIGQLEYLSIAFLEHDIDHQQTEDLQAIIASGPEYKRTFDSVQKSRLTPPQTTFSGKKSLRKKTLTAKVLRISAAVVSAAATLALFITISGNNDELPASSALISENKTPQVAAETPSTGEPSPVAQPVASFSTAKIRPVRGSTQSITEKAEAPLTPDLSVTEIIAYASPVTALGNPKLIGLPVIEQKTSLLALNIESPTYANPYPESNRVERFIRSVLRERILKVENNTEEPVRGYEVAEAGIEGLNRLFSWEMTLVRNNDGEGETESVNFNSSLVKFNAPVKKTEPSL